MTPLHCSAQFGHLDIVREILLRDGNVNAQDDQGRTPLHWVAGHGKSEAVLVLLAAGASRSTLDKEGKTAEDLALAGGHSQVATLIRDSQPKKSLPKDQGNCCQLINCVQDQSAVIESSGRKL